MGKSRKGGLLSRRKSALARLKAQYKEFKSANEDKKPWTTTRNGKPYEHTGRKYNAECERLSKEISILKEKITRGK